MKKGCFLKFIIIFTIFVAVILYIVQNKFDEFIVQPGKNIFDSKLNEKLDRELGHVRQSKEKDSLKTLISIYLSQVRPKENISDESKERIKEQLGTIINDSTVDAVELSKIQEIISKALKNDK